MRSFFRGTKCKVLLGVVAVLLAGVITAAATYNNASPISSVFGTIFSPLQKLSSYLSESISSFSGGFVSSSAYQTENEALKKQLEKYQNELADYEEMKRQNEQYEELLQVKEQHPDQKYETAIVIARDSADPFYGFTINAGSLNGISVNDPVISGSYLVGIVTNVYPTYSKVRTILDPKMNAAAYEVRTQEEGFVTSSAELAKDGHCRLSGLKNTTPIATGGLVYTSGVGGVFPRGLVIGEVTEVRSSEHDISAYAVIKPGVDIPALQAITVITEFQGQGVDSSTEE